MQHILIITDQPIVGMGIDLALKRHLNEKISINIKSFDKNDPIGLTKEIYNGLIFCLTTNNADHLAKLGKPLQIPTLICANIKKRDSIKKLVEMGLLGFLCLKSDINELITAIETILAYKLYIPKKYTTIYAELN